MLFLLLINCRNDSNKNNEKTLTQELEYLYSKEIIFTKYHSTVRDTNDMAWDSLFFQKAKILVYIDSTGCTDCRIHELRTWKNYMEDIHYQADLLFIFQTKDLISVKHMVSLINLNPEFVFYDTEGKFDKQNSFIKTTNFNTFLLNKDNHIIAIGSPLFNPELWKIYKNHILKQTKHFEVKK